MVFNRSEPNNELPELPPSVNVETPRVLRAAISASRELATLKAVGGLIPNQAVLINTVPLLEAQSSSEIENIVTTSDELFRLSGNERAQANPAAKEALRYRTALLYGFESLVERPLCTRTAVEVCTILRDIQTDIRKVPGTTIANAATGEVLYTPPEGEEVLRGKLANWECYLHENKEIDPLIRMAVAHYQFEAIHPFTDGNGRTGRILNILFLIEAGLLELPVLYLSRFIMGNKDVYYQNLRKVTEKEAWEEWVLYMLAAVEETAKWTADKIRAVRELLDHTCEYARDKLPKIYNRELVEATFVQPYCRIQNVVDTGLVKRETASEYLKQLASVGVLEEQKHGREKLFLNNKMVKLLTSDENVFAPF
jgi:Fic family protein